MTNNNDPTEIWLEPPPGAADTGRLWCDNNPWDPSDYDGQGPTRYIRADIAEGRNRDREALVAEVARLRKLLDRALGALECCDDHPNARRALAQIESKLTLHPEQPPTAIASID